MHGGRAVRFAEIIDDVLAGRTYIRKDEEGNQRECYYRQRYDRFVFVYTNLDVQEEVDFADDWYSYLPYSEDLTADDWEPEGEDGVKTFTIDEKTRIDDDED